MSPAVEWIVAAILLLAPYREPDERPVSWRRYTADASREMHALRMQSIAEDVAAVVAENPSLPGMSRASTTRLILSVAHFESGFQHDVDLGVGKFGRGDFGRSWCLMQIQVGAGTTGQLVATLPTDMREWTGRDLVTDRRKCLRTGLEMMRRSISACSALPASSRLSAYATGACDETDEKGRSRWRFAGSGVLGRSMPKDSYP